jgi:hypothetical protein
LPSTARSTLSASCAKVWANQVACSVVIVMRTPSGQPAGFGAAAGVQRVASSALAGRAPALPGPVDDNADAGDAHGVRGHRPRIRAGSQHRVVLVVVADAAGSNVTAASEPLELAVRESVVPPVHVPSDHEACT